MPSSVASRTAARAEKIARAQKAISDAAAAFALGWASVDKAEARVARVQADVDARVAKARASGQTRINAARHDADQVRSQVASQLKCVVDKLAGMGMKDDAIAEVAGATAAEIAEIRKTSPVAEVAPEPITSAAIRRG